MSSAPEELPRSERVAHWIEKARRGEPEALGRMLEACRQYLLLVANEQLDPNLRGKVGASDLVQETFLEAQRAFGRFHGHTEDELLAWLRRILLNNVANVTRHYREATKRDVAREVPLASVPLGELVNPVGTVPVTPRSQALARERDDALRAALDRLPEHYRQVVRWRNYDRQSFEAIGRRLGRSEEAARKLWVRALEQLQQVLEPPHESG